MKKVKETPFKRLINVFPNKHLLVIGVIISILYSSTTVIFGYLLKVLIDAASEGSRDTFFFVLQISLVFLFMNALFIYFRTKTIGKYTEEGVSKLRLLYAESITYLAYDTLKDNHSGDLTSRGTNDMTRVHNFTFNIIPKLIEVPLTALLALIVLLVLSWQLTLFTFVMIPLLVIGSGILIKPIAPASKKMQEKLGSINALATDFIQGIEVSKAYNLEDHFINKHAVYVDDSVASGKHLAKIRGFLSAFSEGFSILPFITTFVFGGYLVIKGSMTIGSLLAFINLLNFLTWPLSQASLLIGDSKRDLASANRIFEMIDGRKERTDGSDFPLDYNTPIIEFDHVYFTYPGDQAPVIRDLNLSINHGQSVAFVGPSGGGKSTITKLLMGYYDNYMGQIKVLGHDIKSWNLTALRDKLSLVSQDTFLFPESIYENIRYGKPNSDDSMIISALEKANAKDFVMTLKDQYDTSLGELGDSLSGGQKQRLSIARAVIKDAIIVLLDEATSALDTDLEAIIQETLEKNLKDKTSVMIAHRLSTIKNADTIYVIDEGSIVESGTHDTLLKANNVYSRLYHKQISPEKGDEHHEIIDF